jgi:SPP1 family predicted phage head-tail adaptor
MQIGTLRDRVTIQSVTYASSTQSAQGVASFSTLATVWGAVKPLGGTESLAAASVTSQVRYEIEIRHRADVTAGMRVTWTPYRGPSVTAEILAIQLHPSMTDRLVLQCGATE